MDNRLVLIYVIRILIAIAQTSDMSPVMKQSRVNRLQAIAEDLAGYGSD
ncbi:MAG: hypothetical protein J6S67_12900 [Methanobrevibacter sp.]|nr:hypothetical protein [Methanobrevibacter sp.]